MSAILNVLHCEGIRPDNLGHYLAGLGLLAATSRKWPGIRGCWQQGHFVLLGQDLDSAQVEQFLLEEWRQTEYQRWWGERQKADTKAKSDRQIRYARSREDSSKVRLLDCHIVGSGRNQFNPVLGTGGNIGKRDLAKVFKDAQALIKDRRAANVLSWLRSTLFGNSVESLPNLNSAGTWFVYANKTFNSGQDWYREGHISPWSFLLALEGALLLIGGVGRRLGSRARPYAVFPFVTDRPSPTSSDEVGLARAEFWAPLWVQPANLAEIRILLQRGLARIGQRVAQAPHEFAIAALAAGVDAGIETFVRFVLRQTTSSQVYEALPRERVKVREARNRESDMIVPLLPWLERLPYEPRDSKQKGKFKGLRGPLGEAIIRVSERPDEPESWQYLLLGLAEVQSRVDRNKELRGRLQALPFLDPAWFEKAWPSPPDEILIARAIASVGMGTEQPLQVNIYGVETDGRGSTLLLSDPRPQRVVWHSGAPLRVMADVLERRLIDTDAIASLPLDGSCFCEVNTVAAFLAGSLDFEEIVRWVPPLSLIRWREIREHSSNASVSAPQDGAYLLHALFRPLFHPLKIFINGSPLFPDNLHPRAVTARRLLNLIRAEAWEEAIRLARDRYLAAGRMIVTPPSGVRVKGEHIAAALLIPMSSSDVTAGIRRWLEPTKKTNS